MAMERGSKRANGVATTEVPMQARESANEVCSCLGFIVFGLVLVLDGGFVWVAE